MKKYWISKGKAIVACMSAVSILAVSLLSVFSGMVVIADAESASCKGTIVEKWDKVSDGVSGDWYDGNFEKGDGSPDDPFIISSAEELAWLCKNATVENSRNVYYKVDPSIKAFDMNTVSGVALTKDDLTANDVKDKVEGKVLGKVWHPGYSGCFAGHFDGNGVIIYGLYAGPAYYNQTSLENNSPTGCEYGALFGKIDPSTASFENFTIKNSYFCGKSSGAVFGTTNLSGGSAVVENVVVANCYFKSTSGNAAGVIAGYCQFNTDEKIVDKVIINNCLVYDNVVSNQNGDSARLIGRMECWHASGEKEGGNGKFFNPEKFAVTNTIAIGCNIEKNNFWSNYANYYSNCYTTQSDGTTVATVTKLNSAEDAKGAAAETKLLGLDKTVWFFNTTTYPQLRVFHTISYVDNGDNTHSEKCNCGLVSSASEHRFLSGECKDCGYTDPCISGHNLETVPGKDATKTQTGLLEHKRCTVCHKTFIDGNEVSADDLTIPMIAETSTYTGTPDTKLLGSGTQESPFLITNADEFAAVALGYVATKSPEDNPYYFKVMDGLRTLYINGGTGVANLTSANAVKSYFETNGGYAWSAQSAFSGIFDGNGVTVYGLYCKNTGTNDYSALFPKVTGHITVKNISVKNSYISGKSSVGATAALVGGTVWKGNNDANTGVAAKNIVIANNYIASTNDSVALGASALMGYFYDKHYATVEDCIIYDNIIDNAYTGNGLKSGMITSCSGTLTNLKFNNIIAIGVTPWTVADNGNGSYSHAGWYMSNMDTGHFTNIYTDQSVEKLQAYNPGNNKNANLEKYNIKVLTKTEMQGAATKITTLDKSNWILCEGTYPQIRMFHNITAESVGVNGHKNEQATCCDIRILSTGTIAHTYNSENKCTICGYAFPCVDGHTFTDVAAVEASYENAGNIAHKHCTKCEKNYASDAAIDTPVTSALSDAEVIIPKMSHYDEWDGTYDNYFWMYGEGDGSVTKPFIISTAEQLAAVTSGLLKYSPDKRTFDGFDVNNYTISGDILDTTGLHFKVKDGITAFYINGGETLSAINNVAEVKNYFENNTANVWESHNSFSGTFNGNGATVYGVYGVDGKSEGLFPKVNLATIKNITLKNSYFKTASGEHNNISAGGIVGIGPWYADSSKFGTITVRACTVANTYIASQNTDSSYGRVGAIAGNMYSNSIVIRDCLVYGNELHNGSGIAENYAAGLVAYSSGGANLFKGVVSIGTTPYTEGANWGLYDNSKFMNVYTDCAVKKSDGAPQDYKQITKLTTEQLKGAKAQENMSGLDWDTAWITNDGAYPTPRIVNIKDYAAGNVWSGEVATEFPTGDGSKNNPYEISAPEYLALMLKSDNSGKYYELVADIMINDTSVEDWKSVARQWYTSSDVDAFAGHLNGNGHTVSGIYYGDTNAGESAGIIPVKSSGNITNITIANSYLKGSANAFVGGVIGSVVDRADKPIALQGIAVEKSVVIDGTATSGALIGKTGESVVRIGNSISKANILATGRVGGLVGDAASGTSIKNSISIDASPVGKTNSAIFENVYTNVDTAVEGVLVLATDAMKGSAASANMSGLDFESIWETTLGDYPHLRGVINLDNGIVGEVWSGNVASAYAGGDGSAENPYLIATGEQLARCVTVHGHGKHYKLVADIYLNDINSEYWDMKIGCNEWYHNRSGATWGLFKNGGSFDGDGYIVYGLYFERTGLNEENQGAYLGLFSTVGQKATIKNVAVSNAYIAGSLCKEDKFFDAAGAVVGSFVIWDESYKSTIPDNGEAKEATKDPRIWDQMPIMENCLVDSTSYIAATYPGGLIGYGNEPYRVYDCVFTGSLNGVYAERTGGIVGYDTARGAYYYRCLSLPQTCDRPYGGPANADWRSDASKWPTTVEDGYYFSMYKRVNSGTKIDNPSNRIGEAAKSAMTALDWENVWMVIENGTPIQQIFAKNHTAEQYTALSDKQFAAPFVTITFSTNIPGVKIEPMVGRMYSEITLPEISREGYTFTGWHVFSDCSMEYPLDYFPPRDLELYAGWETTGLVQNFDSYTNSIYDYDGTQWIWNKPGAKGGYKVQYVRNGLGSMHLLDTNTDYADVLLNYEDMLKIGQTYKMTFWVTTDTANNPDTVLKLVHNEYPEYQKSNKGVEDMLTVTGLTVGEWTQYSYEFTARTPWISLRASAGSSLYFDDIVVGGTGKNVGNDELAKYLAQLDVSDTQIITGSDKAENIDNTVISPDTSEKITFTACVAVVVSCAVIVIISKKRPSEIIDD